MSDAPIATGHPGCFITFEGGEGAGKSTQIATLAAWLRTGAEAPREVVTTREPGGSPRAERIRAAVLSGVAKPYGPFAEALMFAAARLDHLATLIRPSLARGAIVLCDRFSDSTRAYQGAAGGVEAETLAALERVVVGATRPDLTLILDLPPETGLARARQRDRAAASGPTGSRPRPWGFTSACGRPSSPSRRPSRRVARSSTRKGRPTPSRRRSARRSLRGCPTSSGEPPMPPEKGDDELEPGEIPGVPRPREQTDLLGQEAAERAFREAIGAGRLHHAWLIGGPKGIGKATLAFRVARHLLARGDGAGVPDSLALPPATRWRARSPACRTPTSSCCAARRRREPRPCRPRSASMRRGAPSTSSRRPRRMPATGSASSIAPTN